jgi:hypothetical protein
MTRRPVQGKGRGRAKVADEAKGRRPVKVKVPVVAKAKVKATSSPKDAVARVRWERGVARMAPATSRPGALAAALSILATSGLFKAR